MDSALNIGTGIDADELNKAIEALRESGDEQAADLAYEVYSSLWAKYEISRDDSEAISRLRAVCTMKPEGGMARNNIFKAAHCMKIDLPSHSF